MAVVLAGSVFLTLAVNRQWLATADRSLGPVYDAIVPKYLLFGAMILVQFEACGGRFTDGAGKIATAVLWCGGALLLLLVISDELFILYLVYRALAGVEAAQPARFQRPEAYPPLAESYWVVALIAAATVAAILGAGLLLAILAGRLPNRTRAAFAALVGIAMTVGSAFIGFWFLRRGFSAFAPDFAEAGFASTSRQWLEVAVLLMLFIPAFALRLAAGRQDPVLLNNESANRRPPLHLTPPILSLQAVGAWGVLSLRYLVYWRDGGYPASVWQAAYHMGADFNNYFILALALLSVQLLRANGKGMLQPHQVVVRKMSIAQWLLTSAALLLILALTVPTLFAFGMTSWLLRYPLDWWVGFG